MANAHRKRNSLARIKINGSWIIEDADIKNGVVHAFKLLLSDSGNWRPSLDGMQFERLGEQKATRLEEPFSEEEVFGALMYLSCEKDPGPDGFPMAFWQLSWELVKEVMSFFREFHENGRFVKSLNATFLVLIPRKRG